MTLEEKSLRDLLSSLHGRQSVRSILECVAEAGTVTISMSDGSTLKLSNTKQAREVLSERFGWSGPFDP